MNDELFRYISICINKIVLPSYYLCICYTLNDLLIIAYYISTLYYRNTENLGISKSRNKALEKAKGKYIAVHRAKYKI